MPWRIVVSSRGAAQDGCIRCSAAALLVAAGSTEFRRWDGQRLLSLASGRSRAAAETCVVTWKRVHVKPRGIFGGRSVAGMS